MFAEGSNQMKPESFKAGEMKHYILEFDWGRKDITRDWSITAWAEKGGVSIKYSDGRQSDSLPFIEKTTELVFEPATCLSDDCSSDLSTGSTNLFSGSSDIFSSDIFARIEEIQRKEA